MKAVCISKPKAIAVPDNTYCKSHNSFNRLIRGTTKAEPELLDELGIILRLDEATKNYAAQIGKTKEQLTIFEKSQAVTNEVLKQGEGKLSLIHI